MLRWWLHADLHIPPLLFWAMAVWIVFLSLPRVAGLLLNAVSVFRGQLIVQGIMTVLALSLKFVLSERFGAAGILAAQILGVADTAIAGKLVAHKEKLARGVEEKSKKLKSAL